jgi:hypothetical protein
MGMTGIDREIRIEGRLRITGETVHMAMAA